MMKSVRPEVAVKRVYDAVDTTDGLRVLVDRLWPRGVRKSDLHMDMWLKNVAPSPDLRNWFGHDPHRWEGFKRRYLEELEDGNDDVVRLVSLAKEQHVTLLFAAHDTEHNHAIILQDFINKALQVAPT
ncbi:DUF488 domain-containing protein [Gluconobacter sp. OJA]|uniref:DUF488 domain-containing protein n=1 Tax=Gluconobacter sp. OJA TaxID=3145197 RepID=UPI0031F8E473